jgi:hypothetical protein
LEEGAEVFYLAQATRKAGDTMGNYAQLSGVIFALVSALQLVRVVRAWPVLIDDVAIPVWVSGLVFVLAGAMSLWAFRLAKSATS